MAKKREKAKRFSIQGYDMQHYRTTEAYTRAVTRLFERAMKDVADGTAKINVDTEKPFSFADYPKANDSLKRIMNKLAKDVEMVVETGSKKQWLFANKKNDAFLASIMDTSKLSKAMLKKMQDANLDALKAFQQRKVEGMGLSDRVWKLIEQFKEQIESALDVGLGEGKSAQELARDVKEYLVYPDKLFRRVRDKRGNLVLSKRARAFHPGRGVYRSSVKNAQRMTRTEINMSYRESDWQRWQTLDFVVGFEIHRSNHEPLCDCDLCEKLVGKYPKTFKFKGWHPQCMCYATPILMDEETFDYNELGDLKAALCGGKHEHKAAKNEVINVPKSFTEWVDAHKEKQKNWKSTPYFIKDNFIDGDLTKGLKPIAEKVVVKPINVEQPKDGLIDYESMTKEQQDSHDAEFRNWCIWMRRNKTVMVWVYELEGTPEFDDANKILLSVSDALNNPQSDHPKSALFIEAAKRLETKLRSEVAHWKVIAREKIDRLERDIKDAECWIDIIREKNILKYSNETYNEESAKKYGDFKSEFAYNVFTTDYKLKIDNAKKEYNQAILDAKDCVSKYGGRINVTKLKDLINEKLTESRNAQLITNEIKAEITEIERKWEETKDGMCAKNIDECKGKNIEYINVQKHKDEQSVEQIIIRVGGGDKTEGSCASVGLAYAANRGGYNVLDFRDGNSRKYFASHSNLSSFIDKLGGITYNNTGGKKMSGMELMRTTEIGKEYYLAIARHAAIVRQVSKGKYEYMELQSATNNGWHPLDAKKFSWRFSANGREWFYEMIEISKLYNDPSFIKMMGYINTAEDKQAKGKSGMIR